MFYRDQRYEIWFGYYDNTNYEFIFKLEIFWNIYKGLFIFVYVYQHCLLDTPHIYAWANIYICLVSQIKYNRSFDFLMVRMYMGQQNQYKAHILFIYCIIYMYGRNHLYTSLIADLNSTSSFIRCPNWTYPWRNSSVMLFVY